jgi:hypothetical protein
VRIEAHSTGAAIATTVYQSSADMTSLHRRIRIRMFPLRARADCLPLILDQIAAQGHAPDPQLFTGSWQNVRRTHGDG